MHSSNDAPANGVADGPAGTGGVAGGNSAPLQPPAPEAASAPAPAPEAAAIPVATPMAERTDSIRAEEDGSRPKMEAGRLEPRPQPSVSPPAERRCENCGRTMLGEFCYACGQPTRGMVRHFSTIVGDLVDTVFNFDSRTVRTLGPLLFRPGRLTQEYFEGHRVRFVSPVRLFFFFCVAAFLALQFSVDTDTAFANANNGVADDVRAAQTVAEAEAIRDRVIGELEKAREAIPDAPGARVGMDIGVARVRETAATRIAWIEKRDAAISAGTPVPLYTDDEDDGPIRFNFDGDDWHAADNPLVISWLPDSLNAGLNRLIGRAQNNVEHIRENPAALFDAFLQTLPQTLFVLLPVFALLLKIVYLFCKRLYMEHLIVALHSHAFLCAALLVIVALTDLSAVLATGSIIATACDWLVIAMLCWMPIYLLIMQKRVYRQGWIMTSLKYCVLGNLYLLLISFGVVVNLAFSLVAM